MTRTAAGARGVGGLVGLLGVVALLGATHARAGERAIVSPLTSGASASNASPGAPLVALEDRAAEPAGDHDGSAVADLADAYLAAHEPGLALGVIEAAFPADRARAAVQHLHARALFDEGRAHEAQAAERAALATCQPAEGVVACDPRLVASASRRLAYLNQMIALGAEDPAANPEASQVAYRSSVREARMVLASR